MHESSESRDSFERDDPFVEEPDELDALVARYVDEINTGLPIDPARIATEHPELAEGLLARLETFTSIEYDFDAAQSLGTLGDYTLRRQLGRGGMGVVYEAWENSMDRAVALKVLPAGIAADSKATTRFLREAQTAGKLSHPSIVPVFFTGVKEQTPFYAMEYVEGETLAQLLAHLREAEAETETPFGPKDSAAYFDGLGRAFAEVADGLQHAHSRGVVHRDIKPSNLILDGEGRLRILDFGLARLEGQESLTVSGDFLGTPLYMSPEQARRKKIPVDHRTDVYSLGATMYETITGRPPFRGKDYADTLSQIIERDPVEPRKIHPRVPRDLETIVLKCLRKAPGDRYGTAEALGQDLRRFVRGDPIEARPESRWERLGRYLTTRTRAIAVTTATLVLLLLSGVLAWRLAVERGEVRKIHYDERVTAAAVRLLGERAALLSDSWTYPNLAASLLPYRARRAVLKRHVEGAVERVLTELRSEVADLPERFEGHFWLSRGLRLLRQDGAALDEVKETLRLAPGFVPAEVLRAEILDEKPPDPQRPTGDGEATPWVAPWIAARHSARERDWKAAVAAHDELIELQRDDGEAYLGSSIEAVLGRGEALLRLREITAAQRDFLEARVLVPDLLAPPLLVGKTYVLQSQEKEAERVFRELYDRSDSPDEAAIWISLAYSSLAGFSKAADWADEIQAEIPRERLKAAALRGLGRLSDSLDSWRRLAELLPKDGNARFEFGWTLLQKSSIDGRWQRFKRGEAATGEIRELIAVSAKAAALAPRNFRARELERIVSRTVKDRGENPSASRPPNSGENESPATPPARGAFARPRRLGVGVNTAFSEIWPCISPDGRELYFVTALDVHPRRFSSWRGGQDIWVSRREKAEEPFGEAVNLQDLAGPDVALNTTAHNAAPWISHDGLQLYFSSNRKGTFDIYVATRPKRGEPFNHIRRLGPSVNGGAADGSPSVTADGLTLFFTRSAEQSGTGANDVWMVTRCSTDQLFGDVSQEPVRLAISSKYDDFHPRISADGQTLFFSDGFHHKPRPGGVGFEDIWVATRPSVDASFSTPVNLQELWPDSSVNTEFGEASVSVSADWPAAGSRLYFASNRPGNTASPADADIWECTWIPAETAFRSGAGEHDGAVPLADRINTTTAVEGIPGGGKRAPSSLPVTGRSSTSSGLPTTDTTGPGPGAR